MRRFVLGLLVALGLSAIGQEAHAQTGGINDPSFAYYALYLPRQAAQAAQASPENTLNANMQVRQQYAATNNRSGLFDAGGGGIIDSSEFGNEFSSNGVRRKRSQLTNTGRFGPHGGNLNGLGPQGYYDRVALARYYKEIKTGRGRNANVAPAGRGRGMSSGYGGVGGLPGPR
jgi:hypothetical protein